VESGVAMADAHAITGLDAPRRVGCDLACASRMAETAPLEKRGSEKVAHSLRGCGAATQLGERARDSGAQERAGVRPSLGYLWVLPRDVAECEAGCAHERALMRTDLRMAHRDKRAARAIQRGISRKAALEELARRL
jgi:hypothetical protein